jgi:hypothetical protein
MKKSVSGQDRTYRTLSILCAHEVHSHGSGIFFFTQPHGETCEPGSLESFGALELWSFEALKLGEPLESRTRAR